MFQEDMLQKSKIFWEYEVIYMLKKGFLRAIIGFPIGISIGYLITIAISAIYADGYYYSCVPEFIEAAGSEINAVMLQAALCGFLGAGFGAISLIWESEKMSIAKQTGLYFLAASLIMMPVAYFSHWMEHSIGGFLGYFGIFTLIFIVIWVIQFVIAKRNVNKINTGINKYKS